MSIRNILCETNKLRVEHEYELTFIVDKETSEILAEDNLYGDPVGAIIDKNNKWIAIYGNHLTIFRNNKLNRFKSDKFNSIHDVRVININNLEILIDPWSNIASIWNLDLLTLNLSKTKDFKKYRNQEYKESIEW